MKKVWYDARMLGFSGIGTQVKHTLEELLRRQDPETVPVGNARTLYSYFPEFKGRVVEFSAPVYSIKEQILFPSPGKDAILHIPHYAAPVRFLSQSVVVVHDLIHLQSDEFAAPHFRLYARTLLGRVAAKAAAIVTVSDYTRNCLLERYPHAADRTTVIHNGIDHSIFRPASGKEIAGFRKRYGLPDQYLLCVGIGKRHKNVDFLIRSLAPLWNSKKGSGKKVLSLPLVIGGTGGMLPDYVQRAVMETGVQSHVIVLPHLQEQEMRAMYSAARCLIMPSLLEGFGFPVVEAMACGTPVLSSNRASLPEIAENAALYFDPTNEEDLREKLMELLKRPALIDRMVMQGVKRASRFTWKEHVDLLMAVYHRLLSQSGFAEP
jgi:glycosyltransferase involved in cell wall biosynthesis